MNLILEPHSSTMDIEEKNLNIEYSHKQTHDAAKSFVEGRDDDSNSGQVEPGSSKPILAEGKIHSSVEYCYYSTNKEHDDDEQEGLSSINENDDDVAANYERD